MAPLYLPNKFPSQAAKTSSSMLFRHSSVLLLGVLFFYCATRKHKIPRAKKPVRFFGSGLQIRGDIQLGKKWTTGLAACFSQKSWEKKKPAQLRRICQHSKLKCLSVFPWMAGTGETGQKGASFPSLRLLSTKLRFGYFIVLSSGVKAQSGFG